MPKAKKTYSYEFSFSLPGVASKQDSLEVEVSEVIFPVKSSRPLSEEEKTVIFSTFLAIVQQTVPASVGKVKGSPSIKTNKSVSQRLSHLTHPQLHLFPSNNQKSR